MIELKEETQKKLEFRTRAEKYGPQLRAKFKCWNSTNFPICGLTDKYFIIFRSAVCIPDSKLVLVFVARMPDGSVGEDWLMASVPYYNSYYNLEDEVSTEVLNQFGDREMEFARRFKTGAFEGWEEPDPFADFKTLADWAPKK